MVCRGKIGSVLLLSIVTVGCSLFLSTLVLALIVTREHYIYLIGILSKACDTWKIWGLVEKVMVSTNHNIPRSIWVAVLQITEYLLVSVSIDKSFHFSLCSKLILFYCVVVAGKCEDCTSSTVI
ncbi:unnamed protein product [Brassica napus]|uniref:(rape) hypothetical protein n=1 Tax=Brassica napus TaxID=3708 RepID=A0A816JU25_BRANA|nr:unnamed protein product [Brassica napus]